jgi:hypothetical protein
MKEKGYINYLAKNEALTNAVFNIKVARCGPKKESL